MSKEIVIDGENGFLVPGENPARLADAMVEAIALRQKRSAASIAQTSQRFAANEVFLAYRRVILEVCHEPCAAA